MFSFIISTPANVVILVTSVIHPIFISRFIVQLLLLLTLLLLLSLLLLFTPLEFFKAVLTDGFSLESE